MENELIQLYIILIFLVMLTVSSAPSRRHGANIIGSCNWTGNRAGSIPVDYCSMEVCQQFKHVFEWFLEHLPRFPQQDAVASHEFLRRHLSNYADNFEFEMVNLHNYLCTPIKNLVNGNVYNCCGSCGSRPIKNQFGITFDLVEDGCRRKMYQWYIVSWWSRWKWFIKIDCQRWTLPVL